MMCRLLILILILLLACPVSEARFFKLSGATASASVAARRTARTAKKKPRRSRVRRGKRAPHTRVPRSSPADWHGVIDRNQAAESLPEPSRMLPEEYRQWMKNLTDAELNLYLLFKITDAIPFAEVEAEAKRRKIR